MLLLTSQKNRLFDLIVFKGFSPLQFDIGEKKDEKITSIVFKNHHYYFHFFKDDVYFSPGYESLSDSLTVSDWDDRISFFTNWLGYLKREIEQPDKWAEFLEASKQVKWQIPDEKNTQFTFQEVLEIEASINLIKSKIDTLGLLPDQLKLINSKLDYLCDKAKSFGRVDWKNIVIGTLIAVILQLALPTETSKELWMIFKEIFQKIILIDFPR